MVDFPSLTPEQVARGCEEAIARSDEVVASVIAVPHGRRSFGNTLAALDEAGDAIRQASGTFAFMAYVATDEALRETAREWEERLDKYSVELSFREDLYAAVKEFAASGEAASLSGEPGRLLDRTMRDYRRLGFELPPPQRARVRQLMDRLVELGTRFRKAIDTWDDGIVVERQGLAGLPDAFVEALGRVPSEGGERYRVSLDYPELHPFMSNAESEPLRSELFHKDQRKGGKDNIGVLEEAIGLRTEIASLLGYDSWASYVTEERMARKRETVEAFLRDLEAKLRPKAEADLRLLAEAKQEHSGDSRVNAWDWRFYTNRLLKTKYAVDEFEVAQYFPLDACTQGMFDTMQTLLGVRFSPVPDAPVWAPEVTAFDIRDAAGEEPFARFYMDLHPRPNTYGHAAAFTMRPGRLQSDGHYQHPISAIRANFTRPTSEAPSLLRHSEVDTFWHEFGHILHQTLTRARYLRFSGTATELDFVEAPSQMLEHWCWKQEALGRFARHYRTGEPLPAKLLDSMVRARNVSSGLVWLRQVYFARLDLAYHSPGFDGDTTRVAAELHPITGFPFPEGTHFQSGFGHLFGYDAGYYGYLWSKVFGDDMFTRFETAGIFDPATGADYRRKVLERGGSVDGEVMVREFLGREPNSDAFLRDLVL